MPRLGGKFRSTWYPKLVKRDGEKCYICGKKPPEVYLEIDHKDGNEHNNAKDGSNYGLSCRFDNRRKNPRGKGKRKGLDSEEINRAKPTSAEFTKNAVAEAVFRHWLYARVMEKRKKNESLLLTTAVNAGAEASSSSTITIKRYLLKVCSEEGMYMIVNDDLSDEQVIVLRSNEDQLSAEMLPGGIGE